MVGGRDTTGDTWDQFANLDYDRNGGLARNEWHWSAASFNQRDLDRNGILSRREFEATGGNAGAGTATGAGSQAVRVNSQAALDRRGHPRSRRRRDHVRRERLDHDERQPRGHGCTGRLDDRSPRARTRRS